MGATSSIVGKASEAATPSPAINGQETDEKNPRLTMPSTNELDSSENHVPAANGGGQQTRDYTRLNWRLQKRIHAGSLDSAAEHPETDEELSDDESMAGDAAWCEGRGVSNWDGVSVSNMTTLTPPGPPPQLVTTVTVDVLSFLSQSPRGKWPEKKMPFPRIP